MSGSHLVSFPHGPGVIVKEEAKLTPHESVENFFPFFHLWI